MISLNFSIISLKLIWISFTHFSIVVISIWKFEVGILPIFSINYLFSLFKLNSFKKYSGSFKAFLIDNCLKNYLFSYFFKFSEHSSHANYSIVSFQSKNIAWFSGWYLHIIKFIKLILLFYYFYNELNNDYKFTKFLCLNNLELW